MVVGRKGTPLLIDGDHSVSRAHATLYIGAHDSLEVHVRDDGSKFGVHINGSPCAPKTQCPLHVGDKITFGAQGSTFELRACRVAFCIANMRSNPAMSASQLAARAGETGIDVMDSVDESTHLITPTLAVTSKLIGALVFGCRITSPDYLERINSLSPALDAPNNRTPEAVDAFLNNLGFLPAPPLPTLPSDIPIDLSAVDWTPNPARKQLFVGKLCLFSNQTQHEKYKSMIRAAGGSSAVLACVPDAAETASTDTPYYKTLIDKALEAINAASIAMHGEKAVDPCLILPQIPYNESYDTAIIVQFVKAVARTLGVRPISESEIGLSVLFVTNKTHTNSRHIDGSTAQTNSNDIQANSQSKIEADKPVTVRTEKADSNTTKKQRQRRGLRYSNFWSTMVAGGASRSDNDKVSSDHQTPDTTAQENNDGPAVDQAHPKDPKENPPPRRRREIDAFWSASIEESEPQTTIDPTINYAKDGDSMPLTGDSGVQSLSEIDPTSPLSTEPEPTMLNPRRIAPLVKPKQRTHTLEATADTSKPNFKRFRKTAHLY
ncbi:hypothetical protein IW140_004922 [Coemansia sp. RSA 1813]|nr:hypothetical protein EV178_005215 [Coemansia sp. RSA 1646]KAJ1771917.1 hypothetical protein LPJ74_001951 [Coemansia sp. RSA 1843]KAJ2087380.1 hypothetical protein IW138_004997 [Coemansia sp. RSA 986]KAJ2212251.1 hypothetical protein EV179_004802 [Coemansia sp. RSA 487]KAJ2566453.1 hypothetical protein IW140_004922 [Coemansia sp. RSA 1813]